MLKLIIGFLTGFSIGVIGHTLGVPTYVIITLAFATGWAWDAIWNRLF